MHFAVFVGLVAFAAVAFAAVPADQVTSLPGWSGALPTKQYSGYLSFGAKHLHYWFVESENDPANDPVLLWFNGGPGCSSLEGYLYEHGPFHINPNNYGELYYNNYTWTKAANVIYLEAPAGVGFSYSDDKKDYKTNDEQNAADNLAALEVFFTSYPEFASNDFYISGESYAGVYVPTLAYAIYNATQAGTTKINLKGILVGNGCTGSAIGACSAAAGTEILTKYCYAHGFFSTATYEQILAGCNDWKNMGSVACLEALALSSKEIGAVNIYDIYAPCINSPQESTRSEAYSRAPVPRVGGPDECIDSTAANYYLNQPIVQAAIHVKPASFGNWSVCGNSIDYTSTVENEPATIYPTLIANYRVWIYNGDADACVPYTDNEAWTSGMGYPVQTPWHPWTVSGQVAGYSTVYSANGFTFATVKGAGHMVPQYQPPAALYLLTHFLKGTPL